MLYFIFLSQVIFVFLCFFGMVMYANEVETKEKQKLPEIKQLTTTYTIFRLAENIVYLSLFHARGRSARSIQPKFRPVRPGKVFHLKRWTSLFETFPVGPNRSIGFWTEISLLFEWIVPFMLHDYMVLLTITCSSFPHSKLRKIRATERNLAI